MNKKIYIILGTKAQLIKMAPVMSELQHRKIPYTFIFTGQHRETIKELLETFKLKKPDFTLHQGKDITKIGQMFIWGIKCFYKALKDRSRIFPNKNGLVLIHGDTASTVLGAIIGKLCGQKIGYVEAGLRSKDLFNPFPEEIFRLISSRLTDIHFCSGEEALKNSLKHKGVKVNTEANTLFDSLQLVIKDLHRVKIKIPNEKYCIVSIHRFENIFNRKKIEEIIEQVVFISKEIKVLFILHQPTKEKLKGFNFYKKLEKIENIELRPRYDYFKFIKLLYNSQFIVTDGGSNQEESFYLGKPCLLMRSKTERQEGLDKNVLISNYDKIIINDFLNNYQKYSSKLLNFKISPSKIIVDYFRKN